MASTPTISASPNPALSSSWSLTQRGPTTISWDTGNTKPSGTVWVTDESGLHALIDRTGKPAVGVTSSAPTQISLGKTYLFELKRTDNPAVILASVSVECQELMGLPEKLLDDIRKRMPLLQGITNLRVFPAVDSVRIMFRTRQPTVPVIDIKDATTQALAGTAFPLFAAARQLHDFAFPLAQDTNFAFHIFAPPATGSLSTVRAAEQSGLFRTGWRSAQVFFDHVFVHTDGDPGSLGDGDFTFDMGAGDIDGGQMLGATQFKDEISGGEDRAINQSVAIAQAPVGLWVQVQAQDDDSFFGMFGHNPYVTFAPEGSEWQTYDDFVEWATVTKWFDLSDAGPVPQELPFTLETGPRHIDFSLNGRLRIEARPGVVVQPMVTKSAGPRMRAKTMAMMVKGERIALTGRRTQFVQLAPNGGLYHAYATDRATAADCDRNVCWTRLASDVPAPLTVIAEDDGPLHLLTVGNDGEVLHRALSPEAVRAARGHDTWNSLGGSFVPPLAAAVTTEGIDLFALSAEGGVFHSALTNHAASEWTRIGEGVTGSLNAFTTRSGEIALVALGCDGDILHLPWVRDAMGAAGPKWQTLGIAPPGTLSAGIIDDVVVLAVLAEDETVHAAPWRDCPTLPPTLEWRKLGTMNTLISARYALLPLVAAPGRSERSVTG